MDTPIKATVIIPVKNGGTLFCRVLDTVMSQVTPWPFDCLVLDSGSSDGSLEYAQNKPGVTVQIIPPGEFGHGKTRNVGVGIARGEFIAMITHDALPASPNWLKNLVSAMEMAPDVAGAFGSHLAYPDARPSTKTELKTHFACFGPSQTLFRLEDPERYAREEGHRQFLHFFSDNNACLRKSVWEKHPYPDVDFAEDQLWAKTIIEAGYAKVYAPEAAVYHSHDFGIFETGQRAYDESRAFHRLFAYTIVPSLLHAARAWLYLCRRNILWTRQTPISRQEKLSYILEIPFLAAAKMIGAYLGEREAHLPTWLVRKASRDKALQAAASQNNPPK